MENLISINNNMKDREFEFPTFIPNSNSKIKLSDPVILYNNGINWKLIPLEIFLMYPLIHDVYYDTQKNPQNNITTPILIYVCPYTLFSSVYFTKLTLNDYVYNNNITLIEPKDNLLYIPIKNEFYDYKSNEKVSKYIRRNESRLMTLRNAISMYPDTLFIDMQKIDIISPLVSSNYLMNNHIPYETLSYPKNHPAKKIVYIIEYKSKKINHYKYSIIIPDDPQQKINTFDIVKNGFNDYFSKMIKKIRDKGGIIYTCYWFSWSGIHKKENYKIITL